MTIEETLAARSDVDQLRRELSAANARIAEQRERLAKAFDELTKRETRILDLEAQLAAAQKALKKPERRENGSRPGSNVPVTPKQD